MSDTSPTTSDLSPAEAVLVLGVGVVAGAAAVVWAGAALAAASSGHHLDAALGDAVAAARALPSHLGDPAGAWPPRTRSVLPGPGPYWLATTAVAVLAVAGVALALRMWRRLSRPARIRLGVDTQARFATRADLATLVVASPPPAGRLVLGVVEGVLVATEDRHLAPVTSPSTKVRARQGDRGSVAVIGPARSGKTANLTASLLEWSGPAVVVSVKRDLIDATLARRAKVGDIAVFDPSGVSGMDLERLARWSPLRAAASATGAQKAATALAAAIPRAGVEGGMDYFAKQAEILLAGLLGTAALDPARSMADVARWVLTKDMPTPGGPPSQVLEILRQAVRDPARSAAAEAAIVQLDSVWKNDERTRSQFYATAQTAVHAWLDPAVAASARRDEAQGRWVDLEWLAQGGRANTLYLVSPLDDQRRLAPVLGGLLGDLKDQAYQWDVAGRRLPHPLLLVVDEAGNMPLSWLPEVASTCAGIGILLVTIWQSKAQIDAAYGRLADAVLTNHLTKVVFSGCSDPSTLDYVSRLLGEEEVPRRSWSAEVGAGRRRSISEAPSREALTPFHLLRQVRPGEAVLIHATLPPAHLHARRWWEDPRLIALHDGREPTASPPMRERVRRRIRELIRDARPSAGALAGRPEPTRESTRERGS